MSTVRYFSRRLHVHGKDDTRRPTVVDESELLATPGPKIILGEPGMGKTKLIDELGRRLSIEAISAQRFIASRKPGRFLSPGKPLLIDGLDEAMARQEGDAVDQVLSLLEDLDYPDFILSCRSREWQSRSTANVTRTYSVEPSIFTIKPFTRQEAFDFLQHVQPSLDGNHILDHLETQGIAELYHNPLTLDLMGRVAAIDTALPATRAGLFERVCSLLWPEHDKDRVGGALGQISEEQALSAAGALCAGLLLAGADAISLHNPGHLLPGDIRLAELRDLPDTAAASAIFSSKLFQSLSPERAKPLHRVVAEFLGARWLSNRAGNARVQRRLLAQLHVLGGVPSSLRGLHAWLAYHNPAMARAVISADPYGVLRYGETSNFTSDQAHCLLDSLESLSKADPFFRSQDWGIHKSSGLMHLELKSRIEEIVSAPSSNDHLRALLIESLVDAPLAGPLSHTLEQIVFSEDFFYHEREHAARAIKPYRDHVWWQQAVQTLQHSCTRPSFQLAQYLIEEIDCDVGEEVIATSILACSGLFVSYLPKTESYRNSSIYRFGFSQKLPSSKLAGVLALLAGCCNPLGDDVVENSGPLAALIALLLARVIREGLVTTNDAALVWEWLGPVRWMDAFEPEEQKTLVEQLDTAHGLRRAIQQHVLYGSGAEGDLWARNCDLDDRLLGLGQRKLDLIGLLEEHAAFDHGDQIARQDWCVLMSIARAYNILDADMIDAGRRFQRDDLELEGHVLKLINPEKPEYLKRREKQRAIRAAEIQVRYETEKAHLYGKRCALRNGDLAEILHAAKIYLGKFGDFDTTPEGIGALEERLGIDLASDAIAGFEAVLFRNDLPSSEAAAQLMALDRLDQYSYPIIAGLLERLRVGKALSDVSNETLRCALVICWYNQIGTRLEEEALLREALEFQLFGSPKCAASKKSNRDAFAKECIEPSIDAGKNHIHALNVIFSEPHWAKSAARNSLEWLRRKMDMSEDVECAMVRHLINSAHTHELETLAKQRSDVFFTTASRALTWKSVDFLLRFEEVRPALSRFGEEHPELIVAIIKFFPQLSRRPYDFLRIEQAAWIVSTFREAWGYQGSPSSLAGGGNSYMASNFIKAMISRLANDTSTEAIETLQLLVNGPSDSYTDDLRHMAAEQRQKSAEEIFSPIQPKELKALLSDDAPANMSDLRALIRDELDLLQKKIMGDDLDCLSIFWNDEGFPYSENTCRDRIATLLTPVLAPYGIQQITEADMPHSKRADLAYAYGAHQLPIEIKCQWHDEVWHGAITQLQTRYLTHWRSQGCGLYCVFWFGDLPPNSGKNLRTPPLGKPRPNSAVEMREALEQLLPDTLRAQIDVVVIDFCGGKKTSPNPSINLNSI